MKSRERTIYFYDVLVSSTTRNKGIEVPTCVSFREVIKLITSLDLSGKDGAFKKGANELFQIQDHKFNRSVGDLELLINHADKSLADPVFKDFVSRHTRKAGKKPLEGIDISTHVLLIPSRTNPYSALLLITFGSGVTANFVEKMLEKLMALASGRPENKKFFEFRDPSGEADATYAVKYKFSCVGHKSQHLSDALSKGTLQGVELIAHQTGGIDAGNSFVSVAQTLTIKPLSTVKPSLTMMVSAIKSVTSSTGKNFDSVRVRFKDASETTREELFATNDLEAAFVKKERLKFNTDIPSQHTAINRGIMDAMRALCE